MKALIRILLLTIFWCHNIYAQESISPEFKASIDRVDSLYSSGNYEDVISESSIILNKYKLIYPDSTFISLSLQRSKSAYNLGNYKDAITFGKQAEASIESTDIQTLSKFWILISPAYIHLKDKANAILYLNKTLKEEKVLIESDPKKLITAYKDLGSLYSEFGDDELSDENFKKGIDLFNICKIENTGLRGDLYLNLSGNFILKRENDTAFYYLNLAKKDYLNVYKSTHRKIGSVNYNMAVVQDHRGYVFEAMELLKETEISWTDAYGENHPRMAYIQINRGQMALKVGDYEKALNSGFRALKILKSRESSDPGLIRAALSTIGDAYLKLGDYSKALHQHELAFDVTLKTYGEKSDFTYSSAENIAELYQQQSEYELAQPFINLVLKNVDQNPNIHYISILHLQSNSEFYKGNFDKGLEYLDLAISLTQADGKDFQEQKIILLLIKAEKKLSIDQLEETNQLLDELKLMLEITNNDHLDLLYSSPHYIEFYNLLGQWNLKKYNKTSDISFLNNSHNSYDEAIDIYKDLIFSIGDHNTQFSLAESASSLLSSAIETIYLLYKNQDANIEEALTIMESGKNLALKQRLLENKMINSGILPPEITAKEIKLNTEIAQFKSDISTYQVQTESDQWDNILKSRSELNERLEAKEKLIEMYKSEYPKYFALKFDDKQLTLDDIASNLESGETVLNLFVTEFHLYALIINANKNEFLKIELPRDFPNLINQFHASLSSHNSTNYESLLSTLSSTFDDISSSINVLDTKKLLIIPDKYLAYIPFETLHFDSNSSFGDKFDIHYSWSAKEIKSIKEKTRSQLEILAIAPTYHNQYKIQDDDNNNLYANLIRSGNVHLPGAQNEVAEINEIYPTKIITGKEASEENFKDLAKHHRILHLSMHGIVNNNNPLLSSLVFTPSIDSVENGLLEAWEIYNMNLNADLVVLSSCNTGFGKLEKSEGVMSLSRAFAHAGVPSAIMTLWQVPDQSTSEIMVYFYRNLKNGLSKSAALRQAKSQYLENTIVPQRKHPFYWAGLVLTGNEDPILLDDTTAFWPYVLATVLILFLIFVLMRKRNW